MKGIRLWIAHIFRVKELVYIFVGLTAYNIIFDWLFGRLWAKTFIFEGGIIVTMFAMCMYMKKYCNLKAS
jgi:hypothetical protein